MESLATSALLLVAGAITPGPNNLLMLRVGLERGVRAALLPATGVVLGGLAMLLMLRAGMAGLFAAHPRLRPLVVLGGAMFLAWLGLRMTWRSFGPAGTREEPAPHAASGALGMLLLQFVNPKSWLLVLTITATAAGGGAREVSLAALLLLFIVIPYACLALWAAGGALAGSVLRTAGTRAWLERATAVLLLVSALILLVQA